MQRELKNIIRQLRKDYDPDRKKKIKAADLCLKHPEKVIVTRECDCVHPRKHNHHFNYDFPYSVEKLCPTCHGKERHSIDRLSIFDLISNEKDQVKRLMIYATILQYASKETKDQIEKLMDSLAEQSVAISFKPEASSNMFECPADMTAIAATR